MDAEAEETAEVADGDSDECPEVKKEKVEITQVKEDVDECDSEPKVESTSNDTNEANKDTENESQSNGLAEVKTKNEEEDTDEPDVNENEPEKISKVVKERKSCVFKRNEDLVLCTSTSIFLDLFLCNCKS